MTAPPAKPVALPATRFPLQLGPTRRYLIDQADRPFLILGDSPQALIVNASVAQAAHFIDDRKAAGFNSIWTNLLCDKYTGGRADGTTRDGIAPFVVPGDLSTPNEAYFARADEIVRLAHKQGMAVFLDPIETGGWLDVLRRNGLAKAYAYGRYVAQRFKRFSNIVWFDGNDFQSWHNANDDALVRAVARGIRDADPGQLQTLELNYTLSSSLDDPSWRGLIGLDAAYSYAPTYAEVLKEYERPSFLPVMLGEGHYEGEYDYRGPETLRRQEYWTLLSGAAGQFYGNKYTWPLRRGWQTHLDTVGSRDMTFVRNLFATLPWFDLVPDMRHRVLVSGYGHFADDGSINSNDYVTAASTRDGRLLLAYLPSKRTIGVDLSKLAGPLRGRWYDPTRGDFVAIPGASLANRGVHRFTPPPRNGGGDEDWVLVLDARAF